MEPIKEKTFAIYDVKAGTHTKFFTANTIPFAIRAFESEVQREGSEMNRWPEDFSLHYVADWLPDQADFENLINQQVCTALECIARQNNVTPIKREEK